MSIERLISSDSHVLEPNDLWQERMNHKRYGDRIPKVVREGDADVWYMDGIKLISAARAGAQTGVRFDSNKKLKDYAKTEDIRPGAYLPEARLKDNQQDGIYGEVIYPTVALQMFKIPDPRLMIDAFRAYNDWLAEFCAACSSTVKGVGLICVDDVDVGIEEMERIRKLGLVGVMIPVSPREDVPYSHKMYESFWGAAQDLAMPISMHLRSERVPISRTMPADQYQLIMQATDYTTYAYPVQVSIGNMIFSGVFERFPKLKVVSVEFDAGWAMYFLKQMDYLYTQRTIHRTFFPRFKSNDALPSDFFRRNVLLSFQEDRAAIEAHEFLGAENLMWGSDYPHPESTFPRSGEIVSEIFRGIPEVARQQMLFGTAASIYGIAG